LSERPDGWWWEAVGAVLLAAAVAAAPHAAMAQRSVLTPDSLAATLRVAADSAVPLPRRVAALRLLAANPSRGAVRALQELGAPYRAPWVVWRSALGALAGYPYPELASYWVDLLTFPRRPVREVALRGLAMTGSREDRRALRLATRREKDPAMRRLASWADSMLGVPIASRSLP
jgi:hypothetical protein